MTTTKKSYGRSANGVELTDDVIEKLAAKAETGYDIDELKPKMRRGRPPLDDGLTDLLQVRLDSDLRSKVTARAEADGTNQSEVVREALRSYLAS